VSAGRQAGRQAGKQKEDAAVTGVQHVAHKAGTTDT